MNPRFLRLAGLGAFGACGAFLLLYALLAFIATPKGSAGIDRANASIVYISVALVVLALIAVHVVLARQLLTESARLLRAAAATAPAASATAAGAPHDAAHAAPDGAHGAHGPHPTAKLYVLVGLILTAITAVEVSAYYIPAWERSAAYVPSMLLLSAVKFAVVVLVYMHLRYDHRLFRALFAGSFVIAFATLFGLMFLFGKLAVRLGILS